MHNSVGPGFNGGFNQARLAVTPETTFGSAPRPLPQPFGAIVTGARAAIRRKTSGLNSACHGGLFGQLL
jgi:hypothetical protein